jgi:peroxiredoxin
MRARTVLPATLATALLTLTGCGEGNGSDEMTDVSPSVASSRSPQPAASDAGEGADAGVPVPDALRFTATTVDGEPFEARTLAGRPTVLWFWAPWCPKCRAQAAATAKVAADHAGEANVVGVAGLDKNAAMKDFVADTKTGGFPQLSDENGEIWKRFEVTEQSRYVILDKEGKTVFEGVLPSGEGLSEKVAGLTG